MATPLTEIEAKFVVPELDPFRQRLERHSARPVQPRHREVNLRFDLPDASLRSSGAVLRVRHSLVSTLTYKAPGPDPEHRTEIEVGVDDPEQARSLLEALGYHLVFRYEKNREVYLWDGAEVMLDELPFGCFLEIEAETVDVVQRTAENLGLTWADRLGLTYLGLFEFLRERYRWDAHDATFQGLAGLDKPTVHDILAGARRG